MSRNSKLNFGLWFMWMAILAPEAACSGSNFGVQEREQSTPEITIVSAMFGSGRAAISVAGKVREIIKDQGAITVITGAPEGFGVKNPRGYFRDRVRISYLVNGRAGQLEFKNGEKVNLYQAIIEKDEKQLKEVPPEEMKVPGDPPATSSTEKPSVAATSWDRTAIARPEFASRPKNFEKTLSTVQGLMIQETGAGQQFGMAVDVIVQVSEQDRNPADFQHGDKIGKEMRISMEEAIRAVRARYPNWEERSVRFSFGDKYSEMGGGSAGATFALLTISVLEGFEIDPDFAVTGDILVNWKVKGVGAIPAKIRGGITDKKKIVAIPAENAESVSDVMVKYPLETLWQLQIFSTPDLQTLTGIARTDRATELTEAIGLFTTLQKQLEAGGEKLLTDPSVREQLERIVKLAPHHESAVHLLMVCNGNRPTQLSRSESLRELGILMKPVDDILWGVSQEKLKSVSTTRVGEMLDEVEKFLNICHTDVVPAGKQFDRYLDSVRRLINSPNNNSYSTFDKHRMELIEQFRKISVNREMMEVLLRH